MYTYIMYYHHLHHLHHIMDYIEHIMIMIDDRQQQCMELEVELISEKSLTIRITHYNSFRISDFMLNVELMVVLGFGCNVEMPYEQLT